MQEGPGEGDRIEHDLPDLPSHAARRSELRRPRKAALKARTGSGSRSAMRWSLSGAMTGRGRLVNPPARTCTSRVSPMPSSAREDCVGHGRSDDVAVWTQIVMAGG